MKGNGMTKCDEYVIKAVLFVGWLFLHFTMFPI